MSVRQGNWFRFYGLSIGILMLTSSIGCSLIWNAESVDTPPSERMRCGNQLDDDGDGLSDCLDEDCAWDDLCLTGHKPYVASTCAFGETQRNEIFASSTVSRLSNQCRNVQATSSFGGNRSVCGPAVRPFDDQSARGDILSAEYHLNNWNVIADGYCTQLYTRMVDAKTCDTNDEPLSRQCDAPALVCSNGECSRFSLFLNGNRPDGQSSGIVSRNSDLWLENTDFVEIDTMMQRLRSGLDGNANGLSRLLPCNSDGCDGACNMEMHFEPKLQEASGPRLSLRWVVNDEEQLSLSYSVTDGIGDDSFATDTRLLSGACGLSDILEIGSSDFGYGVRLSGPFYDRDSSGQLLPSLVVSKAIDTGEWVGLCAVPWLDNTGVTPQTEYQVKYTRSGVWDRGKLLLNEVNLKRRQRVSGSRALCGPSDVAIFQGGRTVCERPAQVIERVYSVARYFDDAARRIVIVAPPSLNEHVAFEEINGVLFRLNAEAGALPSSDETVIGIETALGELSTSRFRIWTLNSAGGVETRRLLLIPDDDSVKGASKVVVDEQSTLQLPNDELTNELVLNPSTIFRTQTGGAGYTWLSFVGDEIVIAHSVDGTSGWQIQERRAELYDVLRTRSDLEKQQVVDVTGLEVPSAQMNADTQRILLLLTTQHEDTGVRTSHLVTLVRETTQWQTLNLFYHGEISIDPVVIALERADSELGSSVVSCQGVNCTLTPGLIAMSLTPDSTLTVYARTTIDASFRPQSALQPDGYCQRTDSTERGLPDTHVWRRLFYHLK